MRRISIALVILVSLAGSAPAVAPGKEAGDKDPTVGGKTLKQWIADLKDRDPSIAENAIHGIMMFGKEAQKEAGAALIARLTDGDTGVRTNAVIALGAIGLDTRDLQAGISALARLLSDPQAVVRYHAAMTLARLGPDAKPAITNLVAYSIKDKGSFEIRQAGALALGMVGYDKMGAPDIRVTKALTEALNDWCGQVRLEATLSLITLGPPPMLRDREAVVLALQPLLNDRDRTVDIWSRVALMRMDKVYEEHIVGIAKFLKNPELRVRIQAAKALGALGTEAKSRIPDLIAMLKDKEALAAGAATDALFQMKDAFTDKNFQDISQLLVHPDIEVRGQACALLAAMGPQAKSCVPELMELLKDKDPQGVLAAIQALAEIGEPAQRAVPALTDLTQQKDEYVKAAAQTALDRITRKETKPK